MQNFPVLTLLLHSQPLAVSVHPQRFTELNTVKCTDSNLIRTYQIQKPVEPAEHIQVNRQNKIYS